MDEAELAAYENLGSLRAYIRKPKLLVSGNVIEFFVPSESPDSDLALMLGSNRYHDCEVLVTLHMLKDADGASLRKKGPTPEKPYSDQAQILYQHGFFNAPAVQRAIGKADGSKGSTGQSPWGLSLARQLGGEGMGAISPPVVLDWAQRHGLDGMLPREYARAAGAESDE
jgi:hypothetical protein